MTAETLSWRQILRKNFTRVDDLADFLELSEEDRNLLFKHSAFVCNIPLRLAKKMKKGTTKDPLFRQFVPLMEETKKTAGFSCDPLKETGVRKEQKLLQKYQGRSLLLATSACAMHCRYCFRRHFPYETKQKGYEQELREIRQNTGLDEIILSGGDPLSLPNDQLRELLKALSSIEHLKRIRFHTRFAIGIPERIDEELLALLERVPQQIFFVLHINHPNELGQDLFDALKPLQKQGIHLLNQSVFMKGVNDDEETLYQLCRSLINEGILPYYLHLLDPVEGGAHFQADEKKALQYIESIRKRLSGYGVPRLAKEEPGLPSKTVLI